MNGDLGNLYVHTGYYESGERHASWLGGSDGITLQPHRSWRPEVEHTTSRSWGATAIFIIYEWPGKKHFTFVPLTIALDVF